MTRKEDQARLDGMAYAVRQIEKEGIEAFKHELAVRGRRSLALAVTPKDLDAASEPIKRAVFDTVLTMAIMVLHDEYGFGKTRIKRFIERYTLKTECLMGGFVTWQDYLDIIKDELGLDLKIRIDE